MTVSYPATVKQLAFLDNLVRDRDVPDGYTVPADLTSKEASAEIDKLLKLPKRPPNPADVIDLTGVLALFNTAKAHLKYPKVRLHAAGVTPIVLSVAGSRARFPGSINVLGEKDEWGQRSFYGRVHLTGELDNRGLTPPAVELLKRFAADPAGVAAEYGKLTGNCCFCGANLTDERSTDVGYGPVCAVNYGLPWGKGATAPAAPTDKSCDASDLGLSVKYLVAHGYPDVLDHEGVRYGYAGMPEEGDGEYVLYLAADGSKLRLWRD